MQQHKRRYVTRLEYFRLRRKFSTAHVAHLLGHKDASTLDDYERGDRRPSLVNAFRLSVILRTPVEFLFPALYDALREQIRAEEERMIRP